MTLSWCVNPGPRASKILQKFRPRPLILGPVSTAHFMCPPPPPPVNQFMVRIQIQVVGRYPPHRRHHSKVGHAPPNLGSAPPPTGSMVQTADRDWLLTMLGLAPAPAPRSSTSTQDQAQDLSSAALTASAVATQFSMTTQDSANSTSLSTHPLTSPLDSNVRVLRPVGRLYSKMRHFMPH